MIIKLILAININANSKKFYQRKNKENNNIHSNHSQQKNLIFSVLIRFSWKKILPFVKSLIKANLQNCDTVIFVKEVKASIVNNLKSYGIIVYEIPDIFGNITVTDYRWKVYNDFLRLRRGTYNIILSIDIKDSIFQSDIFQLYQDDKPFLAFSYEEGKISEGITGYRILKVFGKELLESIKNKRIINAGVVWGTEDIFFRFANILWEKLLIYPQNGDQYIVNYLIYKENIFKDYIIFSDGYGPVITIGLTKRDNINFDSEYNILNFRKQKVSIVHQYDRHSDIKLKIIEKYCPEFINTTNYYLNIIYLLFILEILTVLLSIKIRKFVFFKILKNLIK